MDLPTRIGRMSLFPILGVIGGIFIFFFILIQHYLANSGDPDKMLRSAASDLGLPCLPRSHKKTIGLYGLKDTFNKKRY